MVIIVTDGRKHKMTLHKVFETQGWHQKKCAKASPNISFFCPTETVTPSDICLFCNYFPPSHFRLSIETLFFYELIFVTCQPLFDPAAGGS